MYLLIILPWSTNELGSHLRYINKRLVHHWKFEKNKKFSKTPLLSLCVNDRFIQKSQRMPWGSIVLHSGYARTLPHVVLFCASPSNTLWKHNYRWTSAATWPSLWRQCIHRQQPRPLHLLLLWQGIAIQLLEISALLDIILSYDHMVFFFSTL